MDFSAAGGCAFGASPTPPHPNPLPASGRGRNNLEYCYPAAKAAG